MLRLLHTADVHLGARHADLGEQAAALRERQFAAFRATVDLALEERVDVVLVAGDLFDSNVQPRRSVDRVAAELKRLADASIRTVIIPGTHDVYDRASVYRAYDLAAMAGVKATADLVTVLTPERQDATYPALDLVVHGRVFATKRAPRSPLADFSVAADERATWHVGMVHGSVAIPGRTDGDEVVVTAAEIGASHLDYLALGHWHSFQQGRAGTTTWAYSGAPEPVAVDQDRAGSVLLVELEVRAGAHQVTVTERRVGRTSFERHDVDAATIDGQPALVAHLGALANPDLVLDARITGVRPDSLDLDTDEVERELADRFFRVRVRDVSVAALPEGPLPSAETIAGALARDLETRIATAEGAATGSAATLADGATTGAAIGAATGSTEYATADPAELREALRLARLLLDGHEVTL